MNLAGSTLGDYRHVCAFFRTPDEEYRAFLPFIQEGFERGDRAVHFVDSTRRSDHLARLRNAGLDVDGTLKSRQLDIRISQETYLPDGRFDGDRMIAQVHQVLEEGPALGFPLTRLVAHAEVMTEDGTRLDAFLEYESRLNYTLPRHRDPVICTYDMARTSTGVAMDVLRTHPVVIISGVLQENPFFVPPDEFLVELADRRARRARGRAT